MIEDKVLHVCIDEKFNRIVIDQFNGVSKSQNDFLIVKETQELQFPIKNMEIDNIYIRNYVEAKNFIKNYKFLIFHSLKKKNLQLAAKVKKPQILAWFSWGGDIRISSEKLNRFYEPISKEYKVIKSNLFQAKSKKRLFYWFLKRYFPFINAKYYYYRTNEYLIEEAFKTVYSKVNFVSTVLPEEYNLVKEAAKRNNIQYLDFTYGDIHILTNDVHIDQLENSILIGHSGFLENNQLDLFPLLKSYKDKEDFKVLLNYGDLFDIDVIKRKGEEIFRGDISFVENYMTTEDYIKFLGNFKVLLLNTIRQQGLGILYLALFYGLKVFLNRNGYLYKHALQHDLVVFTIDPNHDFDFSHLPKDQKNHNKEVIEKILSKDRIKIETKKVLETILTS